MLTASLAPTLFVMGSFLRRRGVVAGLFVVLLFACGFQNQEELVCEEAVSHLSACCPGFRSGELDCINETSCTSTTKPSLGMDEAACLKAMSCSELVAQGYCKRAQKARGTKTFDGDRGSYPSPSEDSGQASVCP